MNVLLVVITNTSMPWLSPKSRLEINGVKATGLWAPFYAIRTAGFGCGNQTAGAFMPNRPYGQSFWVKTSKKHSLEVI